MKTLIILVAVILIVAGVLAAPIWLVMLGLGGLGSNAGFWPLASLIWGLNWILIGTISTGVRTSRPKQ